MLKTTPLDLVRSNFSVRTKYPCSWLCHKSRNRTWIGSVPSAVADGSNDERAIFPNNFDRSALTHPLPRTVLTRSNNHVRLLRQSSCLSRSRRPTTPAAQSSTRSMPAAVPRPPPPAPAQFRRSTSISLSAKLVVPVRLQCSLRGRIGFATTFNTAVAQRGHKTASLL